MRAEPMTFKPRTHIRTLLLIVLVALVSIAYSPPARAQGASFPRVQKVTAATYSDLGRFDEYEVDASSNAVALTLLAPAKARTVVIVKTDTTTNAVTVTTAGTGATINGSSSFVLRAYNDAITLVSNGRSGSSGVWRVVGAHRRYSIASADKTIATTGNTDFIVVAQEDGTLTSAIFSPGSTLAANDTNYITFSVTNLGQAGSGTNPLLAATDVNTTKATGGTALAADTKRTLTVNGTGSNLIVASGDRLRIRAAATGTLAGTVVLANFTLRFAGK
jgi:hypothetical protein